MLAAFNEPEPGKSMRDEIHVTKRTMSMYEKRNDRDEKVE